jgi:hypothetical protein
MGFLKSLFTGDFGPYMVSCPVCGLIAGSKPGGFTNFYGLAMFQNPEHLRSAVNAYNQLTDQNPGIFICWPAVVMMHVSQSSLKQYQQAWVNDNPGNYGVVWQDIQTMLDGKASHDPVVV